MKTAITGNPRICATLIFGMLVGAWIPGCLKPSTSQCSWDLVCPPGTICHEPSGQCVLPEQAQACEGILDGEDCQYSGVPYGVCVSRVCQAASRCGNGDVDEGEECDDGNTTSGDGCSADCLSDETCGNGYVDVVKDEACDDGPDNSDEAPDACRTNCSLPRCGDGVVDSDEACDDGNTVSGDNCSGDCHSNETCGNGYVDFAVGEDCDDGTENSDTTPDACRQDCTLPYCGDGVADPGYAEACDGTDLAGQDCEGIGFSGGTLVCDTCQLDDRWCFTCGNGSCQPGETPIICPSDCLSLGVSLGQHFSCAVLADGTVRCWGSNLDGRLGVAGIPDSNVPVVVPGLSDVVSVSAGEGHTCALIADGTVKCWGDNYFGQLGDGTAINTNVPPVDVSGITDAIVISAGTTHTCALINDGSAFCWGKNMYGQLGNGTNTNSSLPVAVSNIVDAVAISAGQQFTCAAFGDGTERCWGYNGIGALGDGTNTDSNVPVTVVLSDIVGISGGVGHNCALLWDGTGRCWGSNTWGVLGDGTGTHSNLPVPILNLSNVVDISAGWSRSCAVLTDGTAYCWGYNAGGILGIGGAQHSNVPMMVIGLSTAVSISARGSLHTCAVLANGSVNCWGANAYGELGDGTNGTSGVPVQVVGL